MAGMGCAGGHENAILVHDHYTPRPVGLYGIQYSSMVGSRDGIELHARRPLLVYYLPKAKHACPCARKAQVTLRSNVPGYDTRGEMPPASPRTQFWPPTSGEKKANVGATGTWQYIYFSFFSKAAAFTPAPPSHLPPCSVLRRRRRTPRATASESKRRTRGGSAACSRLQCRTCV